jgi:hypothetical protein
MRNEHEKEPAHGWRSQSISVRKNEIAWEGKLESIPKDADRYWSMVEVKCEKAMIRNGGMRTIISEINRGGIRVPRIVEGICKSAI